MKRRPPLPCPGCGGPKPAGRGRHLCDACASPSSRLESMTLEELIKDQARDRFRYEYHRERFGDTSRGRAFTLSWDAMPTAVQEMWEAQAIGVGRLWNRNRTPPRDG
jgi:hypothetical protein